MRLPFKRCWIAKKPPLIPERRLLFLWAEFTGAGEIFKEPEQLFDAPADGSENAVYTEHGQEANNSVEDISEFHMAGMCQFLTDLNGQCDDNDHRENIDPCNHQFQIALGQELEQGIDYENHGHAQQSDDQKMKLFVRELDFVSII